MKPPLLIRSQVAPISACKLATAAYDVNAMSLRHWSVFFLVFLGLGFSTGCSRREASTEAPQLVLKLPPAGFAPEAVTELSLAKNDARTNDTWTARLVRPTLQGGWQVASAPQGAELPDRLADSTFINHLMDLVSQLMVVEQAPNGPLSNFGLETPLFTLRWRSEGAEQTEQELRIGDTAADGQGVFAQALVGGKLSHPAVIRGSALQMLGMVRDFSVLRRKRIATFDPDDVDHFELWQGGKRKWQAERTGDDWKEPRSGRLYSAEAGRTLEQLAYLRAESFADSPDEAKKIRERLEKSADYRARFLDREGNATEFQVGSWDGKIWARISTRSDGAFTVPVEAMKLWLLPAPTQLGSTRAGAKSAPK